MNTPEYYAAKLRQARSTGEFCQPIEETLSLKQAYAIQVACTQAGAEPEQVIGYKIGATATDTLAILGLDEPFYGPLYKSAYTQNDGHKECLNLPLFVQHKPRVEAEFVVCIKDDIKRGDKDVDIGVLRKHIAWIAPGLEIVASRFATMPEKPGSLAIADFGANQYMVVGAPYASWQTLNLERHPVTLDIDGQEAVEGHSGMSIYGNPLALVCWFLNQPAIHDIGLSAGEIVSCGTCTGAPFITTGNKIAADYGAMGRIAIKISE